MGCGWEVEVGGGKDDDSLSRSVSVRIKLQNEAWRSCLESSKVQVFQGFIELLAPGG